VAALSSVAFVLCARQTPTADPVAPSDDAEVIAWIEKSGGKFQDDGKFLALQSGQLNDTQVTDVPPLARLTDREWLDLWDLKVSDEGVAKLKEELVIPHASPLPSPGYR
jgi:hypothetical protein